ncbi:MAG TPA: transglutaminase family protein, partial [Pirellulales bacterium]
MLIRAGCELAFDYPAPTPVVLMLNLHPSRATSIRTPESLLADPIIPMLGYNDFYGNRCARVLAPAGRVVYRHSVVVEDDGQPDPANWLVHQHTIQELPDDVMLYLLASRYCEVDTDLKDIAWQLFGHLPAAWPLVQGICNFVHQHIKFDYMQARANRTAREVYHERTGVCRDFTHLAITFLRCLNVPARYCTGYLGDICVPPVDAPMDFSAWLEVFLGGQWWTFDPRNNVPRVGRILIA